MHPNPSTSTPTQPRSQSALAPPHPPGGHNIALEIQATLPSPPTVRRMMRGVNVAFVVTGVLYFAVAISGYAAMGRDAGSNIILSLSNGPMWVRNLARIMVVVHVLAAYQVGGGRGGRPGPGRAEEGGACMSASQTDAMLRLDAAGIICLNSFSVEQH